MFMHLDQSLRKTKILAGKTESAAGPTPEVQEIHEPALLQ